MKIPGFFPNQSSKLIPKLKMYAVILILTSYINARDFISKNSININGLRDLTEHG